MPPYTADVGAIEEEDMEVNNMPGGRGSGRSGGSGRGHGRGHGGGSGGEYGNALEPFVGIGESIIQSISGMRKKPNEDMMRIQPVGDPINAEEPGLKRSVKSKDDFDDLSSSIEIALLKDQVGRIGDLLLKINNRLDSMEKTLKSGEKEIEAAKENDVE